MSADPPQDPKAKDRKNVLDELYKTEKVFLLYIFVLFYFIYVYLYFVDILS
jgi:hypothetical protein